MKDKLRTKVHTGTLNFDVLTTTTDKGRLRLRGRRIQSEGKEERKKMTFKRCRWQQVSVNNGVS